ncbi:MAG: threonylcarbamoyl-AMP synthase [Leptospiraceae bacterium]|nr:threonylcarbamoyl-AMP synthase [Leptospiraceae bacterium]
MTPFLTPQEAARELKDGHCVALPTETVYGLACNALDPIALQQLYAVKGRPSANPVICHVSSIKMAFAYGQHNDLAQQLMEHYWPGPLTILLQRGSRIPDAVTAGSELCGFRLPDHEMTREIIELCDFPLAIPSANKSGRTSPVTPAMVLSQLDGEIAGIVDGGQCSVGLESTVVAIEGNALRILRPGLIDAARLQADGFEVLTEGSAPSAAPRKARTAKKVSGSVATALPEAKKELMSPGLLPVHYQPDVDLFLIEEYSAENLNPGFPHASYETVAVLNLGSEPIRLSHFLPIRLCENALLRNRPTEEEAMHNLYLDLYELARKSDVLVVVCPSYASPALLDRLRRAATGIYADRKWSIRRENLTV